MTEAKTAKPEAAQPKAKQPKAEPKKRKAPVQKDYPNKLAWLKAMTEYEETQAKAETDAKVARLDKRIAAKEQARTDLDIEIGKLKAERDKLVPAAPEVEIVNA